MLVVTKIPVKTSNFLRSVIATAPYPLLMLLLLQYCSPSSKPWRKCAQAALFQLIAKKQKCHFSSIMAFIEHYHISNLRAERHWWPIIGCILSGAPRIC